VEHIFVLLQVLALAFWTTAGRLFKGVDAIASGAGPNGDAVTPPELAADAPIPDIFHPVNVTCCVALGYKLHPLLFYYFNGTLRQLFHAEIPLIRKQRLNHRVA